MKFEHETFMNITKELAKNSSCSKLHIGAVIVKDKRIISTGWNGVVSGAKHCEDIFRQKHLESKSLDFFEDWIFSDEIKDEHHSFADKYEVHAEVNSIFYAAKYGISLEGSTLYSTYSPCFNCSKAIIQSGISKVIYKYVYDEEAISFLSKHVSVVSIDEIINKDS